MDTFRKGIRDRQTNAPLHGAMTLPYKPLSPKRRGEAEPSYFIVQRVVYHSQRGMSTET